MSGDIVISSAIRSNLLALQSTASLQATTQNRLATGKKVSSALDNATSFFTASAFTSRAGQLSGLLDSIGNSVQTLKAASTGIDSITKLVDNLRATARQALQAPSAYASKATVSTTAISGATANDLRGTVGAATAAKVTGTGDLSVALVAGDAGNLTLNGTNIALAAGDTLATIKTAINAQTTTTGVTATDDGSNHLVLTEGNNTSNLVVAGTAATLSKLGVTAVTTNPVAGTTALGGKDLNITVGSKVLDKITFGDGTNGTVKSLDDLNGKLSSAGLIASVDASGVLNISTTSQTESKGLTISGTATGTGNPFTAGNVPAPARTGAGAATRDGFVSQFNALRDQIDSIAKDSSFNGVNLLKGDTLSVIFNETSTSKLDIQGTTFDSAGLGISKIGNDDFSDGNSINAQITKLDAATSSLQSQASKFGSNLSIVQVRQDFSKNLINTLQTGADNLTLADTNEEAANLLSLQTRQQLSQSSLSLANQAAQGVLRLF